MRTSDQDTNIGNKVPPASTSDNRSSDEESTKGFNYLKRDVIRLLGILCYENKMAQDRIRECGGIHAIMNMCVPDDRNPCGYFVL